MRAKGLILLAVATLLLGGAAASAAEKPDKPRNIKPSVSADTWRDRAMKARAEFAPDGSSPVTGTARARDERGDRSDGEEAGSGRLREDRGQGSDLRE